MKQCVVIWFAMLAVCGCSHCREVVVTLPANAEIVKQLQAIDPASDPLAKSTPIIDIHTHTFNARYLPIRGIALGKRDKFFLSQLIPDAAAILFADFIVRTTELADIPGKAAAAPRSVTDVAKSELDVAMIRTGDQTATHPLITGALKVLAKDEPPDSRKALANLNMMRDQADLLRQGVFELNTTEQAALEAMDEFGKEGFLKTIRRSDGQMDALHLATYGDQVKLIVSHMMDLGPVYDQPSDSDLFLDFATEQVKRYEYFQSLENARSAFFVAYNPYRDHWKNGKPGDALAVVKDAIKNHGAIGVKFYPPSGYRATGNEIPARASSLFSVYPGQQWDARYKGITNGDLDHRLMDLLDYCETEQIPIFAHCASGEFEARSGYGRLMANPKWWKQYLEQHTKSAHAGAACNLRLCLAHAGGGAFLFGQGTKDDIERGDVVLQLCRDYPNVYCEVGALDEILDAGRQAYFVEHLASLMSADPRLADKIMYGTDWNMNTALSAGVTYLRKYQQAFLHPSLSAHFEKFFFENAVEFLDLDTAIAEGSLPREQRKRPLPDPLRKRLEVLAAQREQISDARDNRLAIALLASSRTPALASELSEKAALPQNSNKRRLTSGEILFLRTIFGDAVPYERVTIRKGNIFSNLCSAYTTENKIHFSDEIYSHDFTSDNATSDERALLAHEITHVWQFNNRKLLYSWARALQELLLYRDRAYQYDPDEHAKLTSYRFEQQGQIVQDYCLILLSRRDPSLPPVPKKKKLESIIYSSIPKPR